METDDPPKEEIILPPKPSTDFVAQKVAEYINQFRSEQGVPMKQIQEWLGHSDMSTTANIYSHLDAVSKSETGAAMSKALG